MVLIPANINLNFSYLRNRKEKSFLLNLPLNRNYLLPSIFHNEPHLAAPVHLLPACSWYTIHFIHFQVQEVPTFQPRCDNCFQASEPSVFHTVWKYQERCIFHTKRIPF